MVIEKEIGELLRSRHLTMGTAESCTGGYIAHLITRVAGSSDYFCGGVVSYSNEVKHHVLGVSEDSLAQYGAVSRADGVRSDPCVRLRLCGCHFRHCRSRWRYAGKAGRNCLDCCRPERHGRIRMLSFRDRA